MIKQEYLETLSNDELIVIIHNLESQLDIALDKVEYLTGCSHFGESDGMNGSCVECSYDRPELWKRCFPFNSIFWPWHCEKYKERKKYEEENSNNTVEAF